MPDRDPRAWLDDIERRIGSPRTAQDALVMAAALRAVLDLADDKTANHTGFHTRHAMVRAAAVRAAVARHIPEEADCV